VIADPDAWSRLQAAFEEALAAPGATERDACLRRHFPEGSEWMEEVRGMLRAHERGQELAIEKRLLAADREADATASGRTVGVYRLLRLLGRGGMGEVYLAERQEAHFRQEVALKLLRPGWLGAEALARFRLERQILAKLNHSLIAALLDGGVTESGTPYLVLQYVKGVPITEHCACQAMTIRARLGLFVEVARAIDYAHRNLVVHRDLKPGNILVTAEGQVRIIDFGIAKILDSPREAEGMPETRTGALPMTLDYAAPEQIRGEAVTTATDIHALGILLYEMLTGRRPFVQAGGNRLELENRIVHETPSPPSREPGIVERLHGDLDAIVLKALEKEPDRRYPSAEEMARDVERHLTGKPVQARAPTLSYRFGKFVRRNRIPSALAIATMALLLGLIGTALVQSARAARERDLANSERRKSDKVVELMLELFASANPMNTSRGSKLTVGEFLLQSQRAVMENRNLDPAVQVRLKQVFGNAQFSRSKFDEAGALLQDALRQSVAVHGETDPATAAIRHDLALLSAATEPAARAIPLLRASLARHKSLYGEKHEKVAACLQDLGAALPPSAEKLDLLQQALAMYRVVGTRPSLELASSLTALGAYHQKNGAFEEAEPYYKEAVEISRKLYPEGHPSSLPALSNLATIASLQGRYGEAVELNRSLIGIKARLIGPESVQVAIGYGNLGVVLAEMGDYPQAEIAFRKALELFESLFGRNHPHVANGMRNLGRILQIQGHPAEARRLLGEAAELHRRSGWDERVYLHMRARLLYLEHAQGGNKEAVPQLRALVARLRALPPGRDTWLADSQICLGFALLGSGAAAEAEQHFREALAFRQGSLPVRHPKIAEAECGLAGVLAAQGRNREAGELLATHLAVYAKWGLAERAVVMRLERQIRELRAANR
jgi:eukaryotic-like serine/threonine-protein kinase